MYSQVSYVLTPPLLDCRERERENFMVSQMHMVLKSWSLQNGGVCGLCFVLSFFGCDFFVKLMTIAFKIFSIGYFIIFRLQKNGTPL